MNTNDHLFLKSFTDQEALKKFFELSKIFLKELQLDKSSEKIAINFRKDEQRISVNLNARRVLSYKEIEPESDFQFMLNKADLKSIKDTGIKLSGTWEFDDKGTPAYLVTLPKKEVLQKDLSSLLSKWILSCKDYEPKQEKSNLRRNHSPELFEIAVGEKNIGSILNDTMHHPFKALIEQYKQKVRANGNKNELYKFELLQLYKGRPDLSSQNFTKEIRSIQFKNLVYHNGIAVLYRLSEEFPEDLRACFQGLFNEAEELENRIKRFSEATLELYRRIEPKLQHHQDERSISTYLTFRNPEVYTFFKDSFYQKLCKKLGVSANEKGQKYSHYLKIVREFIENYIKPDKELLELKKSFITKDCYQDETQLIFAQDILYQTLDQMESEVEQLFIDDSKVYKVSMGEFSPGEIKAHIEKGVVLVHKNTKALARSLTTQAKVFENEIKEGDFFYLTRGNEGIILLGKFKGNANPCYDKSLAENGWLQREFELVRECYNQSKFKRAQRWWTPNHNSTLSAISDLKEANESLFKPYFNLELVQGTEQVTAKPYEAIMSKNIILYGPPGTGKTFNSVREAVKIALGQEVNEFSYKKEFNRLRKEDQIEFVTFHQNYSYEDFVVGIKPDPGSDQLKFRAHQGIFYKIAKAARDNYFAAIERSGKKRSFEEVINHLIKPLTEGKEVEVKMISGKSFWLTDITDSSIPFRKSTGGTHHGLSIDTLRDLVEGVRDYPGGLFPYYSPVVELIKKKQIDSTSPIEPLKNFVLIIDEINRANISRVFGELITLLEDDKRLGADNELTITLPNKEAFNLPPNLFIIGTMNTADKSIALVDIALRRRFEFKGYYPDYSLEGVPDYLKPLNKIIYEKKKSADYLIGHAYFLKNEPKGIVLKNKVIPLLMEYFSGKTEAVEEILKNSGIDGKYDSDRYEWQVNL